MAELVIMRGLPGAGKTVWATHWTKAAPQRVRLSRDDLRETLYNVQGIGTPEQEQAITGILHAQCRAYLTNGISVVIDATNLRTKHARDYATIAHEAGVPYTVQDVTTGPGECVLNDRFRRDRGGRYVGSAVIEDMAKRFMHRPEILPRIKERVDVKPYTVPEGDFVARAYIVDIDGTLAHMTGRSPYDWDRVHEDAVAEDVRHLVQTLFENHIIVVMSGRSEDCRGVTETWLRDNDIPFDELHMRPSGDTRPDTVVKHELFNEFVRHEYEVLGSIDDRVSVVQLWRDLGLTCYQVADGDF